MRAGRLRAKAAHRVVLAAACLGGELVLGGRGFQLLELQLQLIEQPRRALRARAIELTLELLDLQLAGARSAPRSSDCLRPRHGRLGLGDIGPGALGESAAFSASMSSGRASEAASMTGLNHKSAPHASCIHAAAAYGFCPIRRLRPPGLLRVTPVDPFQHIGHLRRR